MNLSDTFYVALCMTVLIIGVVYWFWTQNQYIQRKLNLLENIVYEIRTQMNKTVETPDAVDNALASMSAAAAAAAAAPLAHTTPFFAAEDSVDEVHAALTAASVAPSLATPRHLDLSGVHSVTQSPVLESSPAGFALHEDEEGEGAEEFNLQPGGIGSGITTDVSDTTNESVLAGMGVKELQRLAEQKKIAGAKKMRKQELIAAIRASKTSVTPFEMKDATTIDLN